jgi:hypothetical protein
VNDTQLPTKEEKDEAAMCCNIVLALTDSGLQSCPKMQALSVMPSSIA